MPNIVTLFNKLGINNDKYMHLIGGLLIALSLGVFLSNALMGLYAGIVAGVGKEVYDKFDYGLFDCKDMFATWAGAVLGYGLLALL